MLNDALLHGLYRRVGTRHIEATAYLLFGCGAYLVYVLSGFDTHVTWAHSAAIGYCIAAFVGLAPINLGISRTALARVVATIGSVIVPFITLTSGQYPMQSEINVVARSGDLLLRNGIPYLPDATNVTDINPYLPMMAVFGVPRALLARTGIDPGSAWNAVGDPRLWCALIAGIAIWGSLRILGSLNWWSAGAALLLVASPTVALELCASGVDLPLAGFLILTLALVSRQRLVAGAICLAAAFAIKWVALLALPIVAAFLLTRFGRGAVLKFVAVLSVASVTFVIPAMLALPDTIAQVFEFPTGHGPVSTPARSPMPGVLLAEFGPAGRNADMVLLAVCGALIALSLLRNPPRSFSALAGYVAVGLTCFFLLAPVGRFGYLLIPMLLIGMAVIDHRRTHSHQTMLARHLRVMASTPILLERFAPATAIAARPWRRLLPTAHARAA